MKFLFVVVSFVLFINQAFSQCRK